MTSWLPPVGLIVRGKQVSKRCAPITALDVSLDAVIEAWDRRGGKSPCFTSAVPGSARHKIETGAAKRIVDRVINQRGVSAVSSISDTQRRQLTDLPTVMLAQILVPYNGKPSRHRIAPLLSIPQDLTEGLACRKLAIASTLDWSMTALSKSMEAPGQDNGMSRKPNNSGVYGGCICKARQRPPRSTVLDGDSSFSSTILAQDSSAQSEPGIDLFSSSSSTC